MNSFCVIGDIHGHLQLALCMAAIWQEQQNVQFRAVFLCGDVGSFTDESQLDSTTRAHARRNPCELEFLHQWSADPQPPWLAAIFSPKNDGGLGLCCPVVMVHGNHEGFEHLASLIPAEVPDMPVEILELPAVDSRGFIRYLPSGWRCRTETGLIIGGIGGIERGQRGASYHELAYLDEVAILRLLDGPPVDLLITHQGPSAIQGDVGSPLLDALLEAEVARVWCHGHSIRQGEIVDAGPRGATKVVPLGDAAFPGRGAEEDDPGQDAWCCIDFNERLEVRRERPDFWRELRKRRWKELQNGWLVAPHLIPQVE